MSILVDSRATPETLTVSILADSTATPETLTVSILADSRATPETLGRGCCFPAVHPGNLLKCKHLYHLINDTAVSMKKFRVIILFIHLKSASPKACMPPTFLIWGIPQSWGIKISPLLASDGIANTTDYLSVTLCIHPKPITASE